MIRSLGEFSFRRGSSGLEDIQLPYARHAEKNIKKDSNFKSQI